MSSTIPGVPPPGTGDDRRPFIIIIQSVCVALAILCVIGRLTSRRLNRLALGADDWTIIIALVQLMTMHALVIAVTHYGIGLHLSDVPPSHVVEAFKILYGFNAFYTSILPMVKISLLLLYKRIFIQRAFVIILWIVGSVVVMYGTGMFLAGIFNCTPINGFWDKTVNAKCVSYEKYSIGGAVVNIATDVVIWILPIPMIWRLHLNKGQKIMLTFIFLLGLFVWAASFIRLFTSLFILTDPDTTYAFYPGYIWSVVEPSVGIICACLLTMNVLLKRIFSKTLFSRYFSSNSNDRGPASAQSFPSSYKRRAWPKSADYADLESEQLRNLDPTLDYHSNIVKAERGQTRSLKGQVTEEGINVTQELHVERE